MLLANKSVTGKRKLIDNWKPSGNTLHIYRIRVLGWARRCGPQEFAASNQLSALS